MGSIPALLKWYILICAALGAILAVLPPLIVPTAFSDLDILAVAVLMVLTVLTVRFPIVVRTGVELFVITVPYMALVLVTPLPLLGLAVGLPALVGYLLLRPEDPTETIFNVSQTVIQVMISGTVYFLLKDQVWLGPHLAGVGTVGAIVIAGMALTVTNYGLVSVAAALQMGVNVFRVWQTHLVRDFATEATQVGIGVVAAILVLVEPLVVPILAVPVVLISVSSRRALQLVVDTHDALTRLVELLELRDAYTAGHSRRVAETSRVLALKLGFDPGEANLVESAGEVHDIGKIIIEPEILHKTDRLTDEEFGLIRQHPVFGASIVSTFASYGDGHLMVRHHHERWDGGGYPDGLVGEAIPIGARIIAVADSYDAMTSARSYRGAMPHERAVAILMEGAGIQWDPDVVAAMLEHLGVETSEKFQWPRIGTAPAPSDPSHAPTI